jgi:hypothetical protein
MTMSRNLKLSRFDAGVVGAGTGALVGAGVRGLSCGCCFCIWRWVSILGGFVDVGLGLGLCLC